MAVLSTVRIGDLRASAHAASRFFARRRERRVFDPLAILRQMPITGGEVVLFLWLLLVAAFGLLIGVGFLLP